MTYEEMCKYVFSHERVDWEIRKMKLKKRQLVQARQISIYLGDWFYPHLTFEKLTEPFEQSRYLSLHSIKTVKSLMYSDRQFKSRVDRYLNAIRNQIKAEKEAELQEETYQQNDFYTEMELKTN